MAIAEWLLPGTVFTHYSLESAGRMHFWIGRSWACMLPEELDPNKCSWLDIQDWFDKHLRPGSPWRKTAKP